MSEMVDRVAKALLDHIPSWTGARGDEVWDDWLEGGCEGEEPRYSIREFLESTHLSDIIETIAHDAARAAIEAMNEPTMEMLAEGQDAAPTAAGWATGYPNAHRVWTAMAKTALVKSGETLKRLQNHNKEQASW